MDMQFMENWRHFLLWWPVKVQPFCFKNTGVWMIGGTNHPEQTSVWSLLHMTRWHFKVSVTIHSSSRTSHIRAHTGNSLARLASRFCMFPGVTFPAACNRPALLGFAFLLQLACLVLSVCDFSSRHFKRHWGALLCLIQKRPTMRSICFM